MDFSRQNQAYTVRGEAVEYDQGLRAYMLQIYNYMASALALTGIVAYFGASSETVISMLYSVNEAGNITGMSGLGWIVAIAPIAFILLLNFKVQTMSESAVQLSFWAYAAIMGLSLTSIFLVYTGTSIARTFFITAGTFGALSLVGYTTKRDLTGMGTFLMVGLLGLIGAMVVNLFTQSSGLSFIISAAAVLIFMGLTAYDTQRLKVLYYQVSGTGASMRKVAVMGALTLYLDFINLFVHLLQFIGDRR